MFRLRCMVAAAAVLIAVLAIPALAEKYPDKWLPVTPVELAQADSKIEPGASYEGIFVKVWIEDSYNGHFLSTRDYYVRLKVFTESGAQELSKIDIDYPNRDVTVDNIRARVVQPDGSFTELDRKAVITETRAKRGRLAILRKSFALAGVRPGSVVEYRYRRGAMDDEAWAQVYDFQFEFPSQSIAYYLLPLRADGLFSRQLTFHTNAQLVQDREDGRWFDAVVVNARRYRDEPDSPPEYHVRSWMQTYYTTEELQAPADYWSKWGRTEWEWVDKYTTPDRATTELANQVCAGLTADLERVEALSGWMRRNFRLLGSTSPDSLRAAGVRRNDNAREALRQRAGGALDAELAFVALARAAGMQARLLRVPTRTRVFFDQRMTEGSFLRSFDAGIRVNGQWRAFDVTTRELPWDMLSWTEEGQYALLCDRDSSVFIETPISAPGRSAEIMSGDLELADDGTLEGELAVTYTGHLNETYRSLFEDVKGTQVDSIFVDALGWNEGGVELSHVVLDRGASDWDPLVVRSHVRIREHATVTDRRLILEPSAMRAHVGARFTASSRRLPVYFKHAWQERDSLRIRIPQGWKRESVESPAPIRSEGVSNYRCSTLVSDDGQLVVFLREFEFGHNGSIFFPPSAYAAVKRLFDFVQQKDRATVTFLRAAKP